VELRGGISCRLVEAFPDSLGGLADLFTHWGVACQRVASGSGLAGPAAGAPSRVDFIMIDTATHAALEAARGLVARRKQGAEPVVALCRRDSPSAISQALAAGFDDALAFPMDEIELRLRIQALTSLVAAERERRRRMTVLRHYAAVKQEKSFRFRSGRPGDRPAILLVGPASECQVRIANACGKATVVYADGVRTAHRMLAERPFDLIVVTLPVQDASPPLRPQDLPDAPLSVEVGLLVAGPVTHHDRFAALIAAGYSDVIQLPQSPELVRLRLEFWLQLQRLRRWLRQPPPGSMTLLAQDALSSLFNQGFLYDYIALLRSERRPAEPLMMVIFRLTNLPEIHASLGHAAGNCLVAEIGRRLRGLVRAEDLAACLGNGQFAVATDEPSERRAMALAARLQAAIRKAPVIYQGRPLPLAIAGAAFPLRAKDDLDRAFARAFRDLEMRRSEVA
jgi:diguanylate cyclase (GGDEF)-like protein